MMGQLSECLRVIPAFVPIDTNGAGQDGDWINLKYWRRALIVIMKGAWAGGTPAVTLQQATDATGSGAKALSFAKQLKGTALTADQPSINTVTSDTFNLAATANEFHLIDVHSQDLDLANNFAYIRVRVASPGANADLIAGLYILGDGTWAGKPSTLPTAIT